MPVMNLGNVASWVSAIASCLSAFGTLAALATATWAGRAAWRQVRHADEQQQHRQELDEQQQASKVAAWLEDSKKEGNYLDIWVSNRSDLPIFDVRVTYAGCPTLYVDRQVLPPQKDGAHILDNDAGLNQWIIDNSGAQETLEVIAASLAYEIRSCGVSIEFRDTRNRVWERSANGELRTLCGERLKNWENRDRINVSQLFRVTPPRGPHYPEPVIHPFGIEN